MKKSIEVINLTKEFISDKSNIITAVDNVSLKIEPGEFTTLLGPSGCGKTTILRMIAGFEIPTSGSVKIGDEEVGNLTPDKRDTAMVFQSYALFPHLNVYDNIAYGLKLQKINKSEIEKRVLDIMELVNLEGYANREPNQLSGGQQQRVALARALVMEPSVLLFDEPLSNLDAKLRISMRNEIRRLQQKTGVTAVYVTHDQAEAMSISDNIIIMKEGHVEQIGTPTEIYYNPRTSFVADFIGQSNILEATVQSIGDKVKVDFEGYELETESLIELKEGEHVKLIVRPESVELKETGTVKGIITSSVFMGDYQDYFIKVNNQTINVQNHDPRYKKIYEEGREIYLDLQPRNIHIVKE